MRNLTLHDGELYSWLDQSGDFELPESIRAAKVTGSLRLLYQCWSFDLPPEVSTSDEVQLSQNDWKSILEKLNLPLSYTFDLAKRKDVPTRIVFSNKDRSHKIS